MGQTLEPLADFQAWIPELERYLPAALPFARLAVCWRTADAWREESGEDYLDALVFAIQDQLYEPSLRRRRALAQAVGRVPQFAPGPKGIRARRSKGMVAVVKGTAASLLGSKVPARWGYYGYGDPQHWDFAAFVARSLWVFETETLVGWIAEAIGEHVLYEGGAWLPPEQEAPLEA